LAPDLVEFKEVLMAKVTQQQIICFSFN